MDKEKLKEKIIEGCTSKELSKHFDESKNTVTKYVKEYWSQNLRTVRKELQFKNHKFGSCKVCGNPLKKRQENYCSNSCKFSDEEYNQSRSPSKKNDDNKKAVCKVCEWETKDYSNSSGALTKHSNTKHPEKNIEFEVVKTKEQELLECPKCNWKTKDLNNKSGSLTKHIQEKHKSIKLFRNEHPELKDVLPSPKQEKIECKVCGEKFKKITNSHLKKHDLTPTEYRIKYNTKTYDDIEKYQNHYKNNLKHHEQNGCSSNAEKELKNYIENLGFNVKSGKKLGNGKEIDLFVPKENIGIEYNGLRYHSENGPNNIERNYHLNKWEYCRSKNIHLIQIFSDEWNQKQHIIKDRLQHLFDLNHVDVGARKCKVKQIDSNKRRPFLNSNHLLGDVPSSLSLGLFFNNELKGVMSFRSSRNHDWELARFATSSHVPGAGGKLFSSFKSLKDPDEIVTYARKEWSTPNESFYEKLGFEFDGHVSPSYSYTKHYRQRFHKSNFAKSNISKKYPDKFNPDLTEWGNMQILGFDRIWDCGKIRFKYI